MAQEIKELMDTDWRVQYRVTMQADTNSGTGLLFIDISGLQGWIATSKLAITKVFWSLGTGVATLNWNGTGGGGATTKDSIGMNGGRTYGYSPGQPS